MAIGKLAVSVRAYNPCGRPVEDDDFVTPLGAAVEPPILSIASGRPAYHSALITFSDRSVTEFQDQTDRHAALELAIRADLIQLAMWLAPRATKIRALTIDGLVVDVVFDIWIDQDQLDLDIPTELLVACGAAGTPIRLTSND